MQRFTRAITSHSVTTSSRLQVRGTPMHIVKSILCLVCLISLSDCVTHVLRDELRVGMILTGYSDVNRAAQDLLLKD